MRDQLSTLTIEVRAVAAQAAAAQAQVSSHGAVCEERQKQLLQRSLDHDRWAQAQADVFAKFMSESSADRARIHEAVQALRGEMSNATIRVLVWVIGLNVAALGAMVAAWLKAYGPHL